MARRLDGFTRAFSDSKIPFLLAEVITDGQGEMVDLTCRYLNGAAAALVNLPAESLTGKRFSRLFPAERLRDLRPLQAVAFSGSAASFPYTTAMGHALTITCYQPAYGLAACILDPRGRGEQDTAEQMESLLPGAAAVLELSRAGLRCLSFSRQMCRLTGRERGELLERYARDFSALAAPGQWQDLLQALRDAARQGTQVNHDFLLIRGDGSERWVNLRSQILSARGGTVSFFSVLLDVDEAYRDRERLRRAEAALAGAREELQSLLDHLPGGYCLLRQEGDALTLLHLSRGLAELLHDSREELFPRMEADPLFPLPPEERAELSAQAARCRTSGQILRRICRVLRRDGQSAWLSLEAVWQPEADGTSLIYAACTDVSREREASEELRFQSQLCGLLLERSRTLRFDYDPQTGTARIEFLDGGGRRSARTVPDYLSSLSQAERIHPDDRRRLASAVRRMSARPGAQTVEYRGNYDGTGWRWYRISWDSLLDSQGNVRRLAGKAEDVTRQRAEAQRLRDLTAHYRSESRGALAAARLDLTADRILDVRSAKSALLRAALCGNTAAELLQSFRDAMPDEEQRSLFAARCSRAALLEANSLGVFHFRQEHLLLPGSAAPIWVETTAEWAEDPDSGRVEAFFRIRSTDEAHQREAAFAALTAGYELVASVDAAGQCRRLGGSLDLPAAFSYRTLTARYLEALPQRIPLRQSLRLEAVTAALETQPCCRVALPREAGGRVLEWFWLDESRGLLMLTVRAPTPEETGERP